MVRRCRRGLVLAVALVALQCAVAAGAAANSGPPTNLPPAIAEYVETQPTAGGSKNLKGQLALTTPAPTSPSAPASSGTPAGKKKHRVHKHAGGSTGQTIRPQSPRRLAEPPSRSALAAAVGGGLGAYLLGAALGSVALVLLVRFGLRRRS